MEREIHEWTQSDVRNAAIEILKQTGTVFYHGSYNPWMVENFEQIAKWFNDWGLNVTKTRSHWGKAGHDITITVGVNIYTNKDNGFEVLETRPVDKI